MSYVSVDWNNSFLLRCILGLLRFCSHKWMLLLTSILNGKILMNDEKWVTVKVLKKMEKQNTLTCRDGSDILPFEKHNS